LEGKQYVYLWADGVHFNIRLEDDRQCILVSMGATADRRMELIAVVDGCRECTLGSCVVAGAKAPARTSRLRSKLWGEPNGPR